ncbi:LOW QUALITY PROTEIN: uncharacterized protein KIAA1958-like [Theristicus caerulescens]
MAALSKGFGKLRATRDITAPPLSQQRNFSRRWSCPSADKPLEDKSSDSEAEVALNDDCAVNRFVEACVSCMVLMVQILQALPSSGAFAVSGLQDWDKLFLSPFFICFLLYSIKLNKFPIFNFDDDLKYLCIGAVSPNTTKATLYALNVRSYCCMTKGIRDYMGITKIPAVKLNELLGDLYTTVKKTDGSDFLATSFHAIQGLDRILAGFSITSSTFSSSTRKLKENLKVLSKAGMSGTRSRNIAYFSLSDEEEMWRMGCLGDDSPIALLSTVVKYNSPYLNMQTLQRRAHLMFGDIELLTDSQNWPFFTRTDSMKQENRVNVNRARYGQIYHEHSKGHKLCPSCLLYKCMYIHWPLTQMEAKSPCYLTAQRKVSGMGNIWYEEQRMGLRSLRGVVPNLAKKVKLEHCKNFTFVSFTQASRKFVPLSFCQ